MSNQPSMIRSLIAQDNPFNTTEELLQWIKRRNEEIKVSIEPADLKCMDQWYMDDDGCLRHRSGKFFSIEGVHVETDFGPRREWDQPLINQAEIGYIGIIAKEMDGVMYFLMQSKVEPGNVNHVQISPTLQATYSNCIRVHNGKQPNYLDYFLNVRPDHIILDQLQSEQGSRFIRKRNRNIIIKVDDDIEVKEDFRWMTLAQLKSLIRHDNLINMDTRTALSGIRYANYMDNNADWEAFSPLGRDLILSANAPHGLHSLDDLLFLLTRLKVKYTLKVTPKPVNKLEEWNIYNDRIARADNQYFQIIGRKVSISNREVLSWYQPLLQPMEKGICAFIIKKIKGIVHFLVQAKVECGNFDTAEFAPTVQCSAENTTDPYRQPLFLDYVKNADSKQIIYDTLQSEEGGRFYREQNRNMIVVAGEDFDTEDIPDNFTWMTLYQINELLRYNNIFNIQARSLLAALPYAEQ